MGTIKVPGKKSNPRGERGQLRGEHGVASKEGDAAQQCTNKEPEILKPLASVRHQVVAVGWLPSPSNGWLQSTDGHGFARAANPRSLEYGSAFASRVP